MDDSISRQAIIDRLNRVIEHGVASKTTGLHPISAEKTRNKSGSPENMNRSCPIEYPCTLK